MSVFDAAKSVLAVAKQVNDAKLQIELSRTIIDLQNECLAIQQSRDDLHKRVAELEEQFENRAKLTLHGEAIC